MTANKMCRMRLSVRMASVASTGGSPAAWASRATASKPTGGNDIDRVSLRGPAGRERPVDRSGPILRRRPRFVYCSTRCPLLGEPLPGGGDGFFLRRQASSEMFVAKVFQQGREKSARFDAVAEKVVAGHQRRRV